MRTKLVNRYYCDFCKKANCSASSISQHEKSCTMNPDRVCGMCDVGERAPEDLAKLIALMPDGHEYLARVKTEDATGSGESHKIWNAAEKAIEAVIPKLREAADGCPACMLAAMRQSGCGEFGGFDFGAEKLTFWAVTNDANRVGCY